jgi:hypothetical protein
MTGSEPEGGGAAAGRGKTLAWHSRSSRVTGRDAAGSVSGRDFGRDIANWWTSAVEQTSTFIMDEVGLPTKLFSHLAISVSAGLLSKSHFLSLHSFFRAQSLQLGTPFLATSRGSTISCFWTFRTLEQLLVRERFVSGMYVCRISRIAPVALWVKFLVFSKCLSFCICGIFLPRIR